jgi:hypothetical protein
MAGNTDISPNMMLWHRGGERSDRLAIAPQKQGTIMSFRAKAVASIAFAASAFLLAPAGQAATQAATHPVQVSGNKLKSALLPASTFGSGFKLDGTFSTGKSLWHQKARNHVLTMSCADFENGGLGLFGESAAAGSVSDNQDASADAAFPNVELLYEQAVYQFPSIKAASAFYNQAHAKYAKCTSFSEKIADDPASGTLDTTLLTMSKTKVGKYQAFQLNQGVTISDFPGFSLNLNTLVTVAGTDVFIVTNFSGTNDPVPASAMLKLVSRAIKLR